MTITRNIGSLFGLVLALSLSVIPATASSYDSNAKYYGQPFCAIRITNYSGNQGFDRTVTISWSSNNAERASISGIGSVGLNGAMAVTYPKIASSYTMTVSNSSTSQTCTTDGSYQSYPQQTYYSQASYYPYNSYNDYVMLDQIPYTGIDYGIFGNAALTTLIVAFALSLAYLAAYPRLARMSIR